jgi:S-DNA-T family DNA segregation ATPase FtsK/SpoIIIE
MPSMFEAKTEYLAGAFGGSSASVIRDPYSASSVTLQVMPEDNPLYEASPFDDVSQFLRLRQADDLIPLGRYETGEPCEIDLKEKSILIAGSPGSGKSVCMQQIISAAALSENTELWCIDPKGGVEILTFWGAICERSEDVTDDVGDDGRPVPNSGLERTSYMLADLQAEMARRYACMKERKIRYLPPSAENPRVLLVIDELASLTLCDDRKLKTLLVGQIRDLVAKGRAAGIVIVLATQYPKVEVLDSSIRSLLTLRVGFRIGEKVASDVVLGDGQAAAGADASEIPNTAPGVGFIVGDGDKVARKIRTHYLSDDDLRVIAEHAESFRGVSLDGEEVEALEAPDDLPEEAFYVPDEWGTDDVELDPAVVLSGCPEHLGNRGAEALQASQACDACKEARFCALTEESSE